MSIRTIIVILLALVCGVTAAVGVSQYKGQALTLIQQDDLPVETVPILVTQVDVARGNVLGADQLVMKQWPKDHVPEGALTSMDDAIDRTATVKLFGGEPVIQKKLAPADAGRGMAAMVPEGMRAFTIATSHVAAGGGFVLPGNHVDVLLTTTGNANDGSGGAATTTLLQNVEILAVAQIVDAPDSNMMDPKATRDVTILVTPNQAAKLDLGMNKGELHLSLRNAKDVAEADTRPATLAELRFSQDKVSKSGEFLREALSNVAKIAMAIRTAPAVAEPDLVAVAKPEVKEPVRREASIRTLRGMNRGMIRVELVGADSQDYRHTQE